MKKLFRILLACSLLLGATSVFAWNEIDWNQFALALKKLKYSIIPQTTNTLTLGDSTHRYSNIYSMSIDVAKDTDAVGYIGRAAVGYDGTNSDMAVFAHLDKMATTTWALRQRASGLTEINTATGTTGTFYVNGGTAIAGWKVGGIAIGSTGTFGTSATNTLLVETGVAPTTSPADAFQMYSADVNGAGTAGLNVRSEDGGVAAIQARAGTTKIFTYQLDTLADDDTIALPDATSGMVFVSCNAEAGMWLVQNDGAVVKIAGSANTAATDSDGNLCVYDGGGTKAIVKNRLGAVGETRIVYYYN